MYMGMHKKKYRFLNLIIIIIYLKLIKIGKAHLWIFFVK